MIYKTSGIVIKSAQYTEADKIVTLLSKNNGIMTFIFKGVLKSKSKKLNTADIGSVIAFSFYKKNADAPSYAQDVKLINAFSDIKADYTKYLYLTYIVELFNVLSHESDTILLYNFLYNILLFLDKNKVRDILLRYVEFKLIQFNGIMPDINVCSVCGEKINFFYYVLDKSHIFCDKCANSISNSLYVTIDAVKVIRSLFRSNLKTLYTIEYEKQTNNIIRDFFHNIIVGYINKELKSYSIVNKLIADE